MGNFKNFNEFLFENKIDELVLECEALLNETKIESNNETYENMSAEELDELCEKSLSELLEDKEDLFSSSTHIEEGKEITKKQAVNLTTAAVGAGAFAGMAGHITKQLKTTGDVVFNVSGVAKILGGAAVMAIAVPLAISAANKLANWIEKRKQLKKVLANVPEGPKKEALRQKLKAMTLQELQEYSKIKQSKLYVRGAKEATEGKEASPPENAEPKELEAYEKGRAEGKKAKEEMEAMKDKPKEERAAYIQKVKDKAAKFAEAKPKFDAAKEKIEKLKEKPKS